MPGMRSGMHRDGDKGNGHVRENVPRLFRCLYHLSQFDEPRIGVPLRDVRRLRGNLRGVRNRV